MQSFFPVYQELNRRAAVLFIHPLGCNLYSPLIADHHMTWMVGAPLEDTMSVLHLMEAGVALKFPKMKIVNCHLGGATADVPSALGQPIYLGGSQVPRKTEHCGQAHVVRFRRPRPHPRDTRRRRTLGADRIVLGSDFPYEAGDLYKRAIGYVELAGFKKEDAAKILDFNAAGLLGML